MFDKLIESDSQKADFRNRSRYFMASTIIVAILAFSAFIVSLYASDVDIAASQLDITEMLAPITPDAPEPPKPAQQTQTTRENQSEPSRSSMARVDDPTIVPKEISTAPNPQIARLNDRFDPKLPEGPGAGEPGNIDNVGSPLGTSSAVSSPEPVEEVKTPEPPPIRKIEPKPLVKSKGVINGIATHLPKPPYPAVAIATNVQGSVDVQVTIDESGKVVSSKAINGHPLLRSAAERAAWNAKFKPTLLSEQPVKVTGVIVYKFARN